MTDALKQERDAFEEWFATHTFNFEREPIGSRECGLRWEAWRARSVTPAPRPIDMVLHCPKCGVQHIDAAIDAARGGGVEMTDEADAADDAAMENTK